MSATPKAFIVTEAQLEQGRSGGGNGASYAALEVPADYEATLVGVEDYVKSTTGWKLNFQIEGLGFSFWLSHSDAARWKIVETIEIFEPGFFDQRDPSGASRPVDPTAFIGRKVGAHVVLDDELDTPRKVIQYLFPLDVEVPGPEDVPVI